MSMLAERKRKQKWSLNPRGKDWSDDSSKFGQKMLEKMGWQHGKGLGPKENGIVEHVKISYKNDNKGMGYKESNDQWTEHESNFTALLDSLSGVKVKQSEVIKVNSLEKKSQSSRSRVHYHKFTRGKDLTRYSEKDLANIFGKKSLMETNKVEDNPEENHKKDSAPGFMFNGGSMTDYFKQKIPGFGRISGYVVGNNGVLKKDESTESESEIKPTFSFGFKSENSENNMNNKSKKLTKTTFVSYINKDLNPKRQREENQDENIFSPKKKLKKDKRKLQDGLGLSNAAFDPLSNSVVLKKHVLHTINESMSEDANEFEKSCLEPKVEEIICDEMPKKNKQKNLTKNDEEILTPSNEHMSDETPKKIKKKKQYKNNDVNKTIFNTSFEDSDSVVLENRPAGTRNKKREKNKPNDLENLEFSKPAFGHPLNNIESTMLGDYLQTGENVGKNYLETKVQVHDEKVSENNGKIVNFSKENEEKLKKRKQNSTIENFDAIVIADKRNKSEVDIVEGLAGKVEVEWKIKEKKKSKKITGVLNNSAENFVTELTEKTQRYEDQSKIRKKKGKMQMDKSLAVEEVSTKKRKSNMKKSLQNFIIDNPTFNDDLLESTRTIQSLQIEENPFEVKVEKHRGKKVKLQYENPNFDDFQDNLPDLSQIEENPYEIKIKGKKKKKKKTGNNFAIVNPHFDASDSLSENIPNNKFEVERNKKTEGDKGIVNPGLNLDDTNTSMCKEEIPVIIEDTDLVLNVVSIPVVTTPKKTNFVSAPKVNSIKRRKSVRFSDVTQEVIIPNNEELQQMCSAEKTDLENNADQFSKKKNKGLDNVCFDKHKNNLEENLDSISKTIDKYQAEIENDINEKKVQTVTMDDLMIGEVGNPHGENEKLPDGSKLKFKYAHFDAKTPFYQLDKVGPRKSYKHLIKGDILVKFKNSNLHEIEGYGVRKKSTVD